MSSLKTVDSVTYDALIAGLNRDEMKTLQVTVASGQSLKRGALVSYDESTGKVSAVSGTESEGTTTYSEVFGVLAEDVDATDADAIGVVYLNGDFNSAAVVVPEGLTVASFFLSARKVGIILR